MADEIISRLEKNLFPGLKSSIVFKEVMLYPSTTEQIKAVEIYELQFSF